MFWTREKRKMQVNNIEAIEDEPLIEHSQRGENTGDAKDDWRTDLKGDDPEEAKDISQIRREIQDLREYLKQQEVILRQRCQIRRILDNATKCGWLKSSLTFISGCVAVVASFYISNTKEQIKSLDNDSDFKSCFNVTNSTNSSVCPGAGYISPVFILEPLFEVLVDSVNATAKLPVSLIIQSCQDMLSTYCSLETDKLVGFVCDVAFSVAFVAGSYSMVKGAAASLYEPTLREVLPLSPNKRAILTNTGIRFTAASALKDIIVALDNAAQDLDIQFLARVAANEGAMRHQNVGAIILEYL